MAAIDGSFEARFVAIRAELGVPEAFPPDALAAAEEAATRDPLSDAARRTDLRDLPLVTIDPADSLDLDQAFFASRDGGGYVVRYAIADVAFFVDRGGPVESEAWRRGVTQYSPDGATLLYPPSLSHDAASLLPSAAKPAVVFTLRLAEDASARLERVERALVESRAKLAYDTVSEHLAAERRAAGTGALAGKEWSEALALLEEIGRKRQHLAADRGAVSLPIAAQHVKPWAAALHGYTLAFDDPNDVEGWNAEISLMTGMAAAEMMVDARVGLLRSLGPPREEKVRQLQLTARALGVAWADGVGYPEFIRSLDPTRPVEAAIIYLAASAMGTARYVAFDGDPPAGSRHSAIASFYAHVTAPLRRLADRYVLDLLVELCRGARPSPDEVATLSALPPVMEAAERLARALDAAMVSLAEAKLLADHVGDEFDALTIRLREDRVTVQITSPAVRADVPAARFAEDRAPASHLENDGATLVVGDARISLGEWLRVRLEAVDVAARRVSFAPIKQEPRDRSRG